MSLRLQVFRGAVTLGVGQAGGQLLSFVRNVVLARLLTQTDYGVAATFLLTFAMLEMASNMAADKLLIQSKEGDGERMQGVVHAFECVRGMILGLLLFSLAAPFARMFGVPEATWAYQALAMAPVIRGLRHLDVARYQRGMRFGPQVTMEITTSLIALAAVWPLVAWLGNYSAVLWVMLVREAVVTAMSHAMAERPYRWAWDRAHLRSVLMFGWPLALNGVLMYAAVQGDRLIVGVGYTMEELGLYAAAAFLAITPFMALGRMHGQLALPALSRAQDDRRLLLRRHQASVQAMAFVGAASAVVFVLLGEALMTLVYGARYAGAGAILAWLGVSLGVRLVRAAANTSAMSLGDTLNPMYSNIARGVGVIGAVGVALTGGPLWAVAAAGFVGELSALAVASFRLRRRQQIPAQLLVIPAIGVLSFSALSWLLGMLVSGAAEYVVSAALLMLIAFGAWLSSAMLRELSQAMYRQIRPLRSGVAG